MENVSLPVKFTAVKNSPVRGTFYEAMLDELWSDMTPAEIQETLALLREKDKVTSTDDFTLIHNSTLPSTLP